MLWSYSRGLEYNVNTIWTSCIYTWEPNNENDTDLYSYSASCLQNR